MAIPDFNFDQDERADNTLLNGEGVVQPPQPQQTTTEFSPYSQEAENEEQDNMSQFKESEYLGGLLSPVPRPVKDEDREKRLEAIAGAKGVGKALSVLGDAYAVGQGGVVPVRKFGDDPTVAKIMDDTAKFREKMEQADFQDYMNKLRMGQAIAGAKERERKEGKSDVRFDEARALEAERHKEAVEASQAQSSESKRQFEIKQAEAERHNRATELASLVRANKAAEGSKAKKYPLYDKAGNKITDVDDGQVDKLFDIIKDSVDIGEDLALLESQLGEGITKEHKRTIVSAYSDIPEVAKFLGRQTDSEEEVDEVVTGGTFFK
jgi:hypothetical protein